MFLVITVALQVRTRIPVAAESYITIDVVELEDTVGDNKDIQRWFR
jgi:hypothetical protein